MKVHLIKRQTIEEFILTYPGSMAAFTNWLGVLRYADWQTPADMLETFASADLLGKGTNRVVFNVGGNTYRLICKYAFGVRQVHLFVCWIGTHKDYSTLCRRNGQYTIAFY